MDVSENWRASEAHDAEYVAERMRKSDIDELSDVGAEPLEALLRGFYLSDECNTIVVNKRPAGMFGVTRQEDGSGVVWLLGTQEIEKISTTFLRGSRQWVESKASEYWKLFNFVSAKNEVSIRWLKFLGFKFKEKILVNDSDFIPFERMN